MDISAVNGASATTRGTKIVQNNNDLDQNAFLKILTAELSNQDPTSTQDPTQNISQMAQFTTLEQMTNLNANVTFSDASSLIGKNVMLDAADAQGVQYSGLVKGVSKSGSDISINVEVNDNGTSTVKAFPYSSVLEVDDTQGQ